MKAAHWASGTYAINVCADAHLVFVCNSSADGFMFDGNTPNRVLVEDNEVKVESGYYTEHW